MTQAATGHLIDFDVAGTVTDPAAEQALLNDVRNGRNEIFVFAHGWNNTPDQARQRFDQFFTTLLDAVSAAHRDRVVTVGVIWPAIRWPDETDDAGPDRAVADFTTISSPQIADLAPVLAPIYPEPDQAGALARMAELLKEQPRDPDALAEFQSLLGVLAGPPEQGATEEDHNNDSLFTLPPEKVFSGFADFAAESASAGGATFGGDPWRRMWSGALWAGRVASYYTMRKRAAVVGEQGLGPLITRLHDAGGTHVHLIGHSFGARLVSFSLLGLPEGWQGEASPVKSLLLLQGAFSHFTFASTLSFQRNGGALANMQSRVDGPLVVTHTKRDFALSDFYPKASLMRGQDSSAITDLLFRWGAMGHDGAQEVAAQEVPAGPVGAEYPWRKGEFVNLDCNRLIAAGRWPFGAHSDIIHPELGWVAASAACLTTP